MMQPAKSCHSCHFGGTGHGPECGVASTVVCCEDWIADNFQKVQATVVLEIDLRAYEVYYQEPVNTFDDLLRILGMTAEEFFESEISLKSPEVGLETITNVESCCATEEEFRATLTRRAEA